MTTTPRTETCRDLEVLVSLRAAGALEPAEVARVEAHLEGCAACRAEAAAAAEALALAALPPETDAERRAFDDLPAATLDALRGDERRRAGLRRLATAFAVAAAAAVLVLAPGALRPVSAPPADAPAAEEAVWEGPDLDALWDAAATVDLHASADASGLDAADAGYALLDY